MEITMLQQFLDEFPSTGNDELNQLSMAGMAGAVGAVRPLAQHGGSVLSGSLIECPPIAQWPSEVDARHAALASETKPKVTPRPSAKGKRKAGCADPEARKVRLADLPRAERLKLMRERNRRHAADCRMRKRVALEDSQAQCAALTEENATIKEALKEACDALEILKQGVADRFGVMGQKLLHEHARHMQQRDALLSRLDTVLAGPKAHDALAAATAMRIQAVPAPRAEAAPCASTSQDTDAGALCFGAPNDDGLRRGEKTTDCRL